MNKNIQQYLNSFKLGKEFVHTFVTDLVSLSLIILVFTWFSSYLQQSSLILLQGRTTAELQQMLLSLKPEQLQPFMVALKWFLIIAVLGIVILIAASFLFFSYSRARVWNYLQGKLVNRSNYWRWNILHLSLIVPLLLFIVVLFIVKLLLSLLLSLPQKIMPVFYFTHSLLMENIRLLFDGAALFYMAILLLVIIFLIYQHFVKSYRVWDSIGAGFSTFKKNWKKTALLVLFATVTACLATLIFLPIKKALIFYPLLSAVLYLTLTAFFI